MLQLPGAIVEERVFLDHIIYLAKGRFWLDQGKLLIRTLIRIGDDGERKSSELLPSFEHGLLVSRDKEDITVQQGKVRNVLLEQREDPGRARYEDGIDKANQMEAVIRTPFVFRKLLQDDRWNAWRFFRWHDILPLSDNH